MKSPSRTRKRTFKVWVDDEFHEDIKKYGRAYIYVGVDKWQYGQIATLTLGRKPRPRKGK
jgi:hypothetical protein